MAPLQTALSCDHAQHSVLSGAGIQLELIEGFILALLAVWALIPDFWNRWRSRDVLRKGGTGNKIALTFDDGPDPVYTPRVLEILDQWGASATFFMVAENARKCPEVVKQVVGHGHEVGSHGMHHSPFWFLTPKRSRLEIQESVAMLQKLAGKPVHCFRPPWGMSNLVTHYWMRQASQKVVLWSLDSLDWFFMTPSQVIIKKVSRWVRPGSIIHDGAGVRRNAAALTEALPQLLEAMLRRGLVPVTVSELMDEGERMGKRNECRERCDESVGSCQTPIVLHYSTDKRGFMGGPAFSTAGPSRPVHSL
jgi:peptidoglycan/xylan/chitin deacetylase (PgdA/CDA1 family)